MQENYLIHNMENLTSQELYKVTEDLYKHQNPNTRMGEPPSSIYEMIIERWYPEYRRSNSNLKFFDWCLETK